MTADLYPTPTRLDLLRDIAAGLADQYTDDAGHTVSTCEGWNRVTDHCAKMAAAGWIELDPTQAIPLGISIRRRWVLTDAGRAVLDAHPEKG